MKIDLQQSSRAVLITAACLLLAACGEAELYAGLTEQEANEMTAIIQSSGLHASKGSRDGKTWTLSVSKADFGRSVSLLQSRGYPKAKFESLGAVFKQQGFVSSPTDEKARLIYGLSQELSKTISEIDGVVSTRVLVALPEQDPLAQTEKPASASVLVKYDPRIDLTSQTGAIRALVVDGVEGLSPDRVTVVMTPAAPLTLPGRTAPPIARWIGMGGLGGAGLLGGVALFLFHRRRIPQSKLLESHL